MITAYYKESYEIDYIKAICNCSSSGTRLDNMLHALDKLNYKTIAVEITMQKLKDEAPLPVLLYWLSSHYIVLYKIHKDSFYIADPAYGLFVLDMFEFKKNWVNDLGKGIAVLVEKNANL